MTSLQVLCHSHHLSRLYFDIICSLSKSLYDIAEFQSQRRMKANYSIIPMLLPNTDIHKVILSSMCDALRWMRSLVIHQLHVTDLLTSSYFRTHGQLLTFDPWWWVPIGQCPARHLGWEYIKTFWGNKKKEILSPLGL